MTEEARVAQQLIDIDRAANGPTATGNKAATLSRMRNAGLPVPEGVVVPPDLEPSGAVAAIVARLGDRPLAVRSSATVEDQGDASFAGQYRTHLRVTADGLEKAITDVRASAAGVAGAPDVPIPVLVMPMIAAVSAGVAFSADPLTGNRDTVVVEAVAGTAEHLVDGTVTPERWRIKGTGPAGDGQVLDADAVGAVADLVRRAAEVLGYPTDIEWAHDGQTLWLLQARPITRLPEPFVVPDGLPPGTWERETVHFWAPVSPLTSSLLLSPADAGMERMQAALGGLLRTIEARAINGYVYGRAVPVGVPEKALARGGGPPPAIILGLLARLHPALRARERAARTWLREDRAGQILAELSEGLPQHLLDAIQRLRAVDPETLDGPALAEHVRAAVQLFSDAWLDHGEFIAVNVTTIGAYGVAATKAVGCSPSEAMALLAGHGTATARHGSRIRTLAEAVDADPDARAAVAADDVDALLSGTGPGSRAVQAYLDEHSTIPVALDLAAATVGEDPGLLLANLRQRIVDRGAPEPSPEAAALLARLRDHPDGKRLLRLLRRARLTHAIRDDHTLPLFHGAGLVRRAAMVAGRRLVALRLLDAAADVVFYEGAELLAWLDGGPPVGIETVRDRQAAHERAHRMVAPPFVGPPPAALPSPRFLPPAMRRTTTWAMFTRDQMFGAASPSSDHDDEDALRGAPASPGVGRGRARRVDDPSEIGRVEEGDVLVCAMTSPAWVGAFLRAGAVITESGGVLSHPAILAREHGVPAVVGVVGARARIPDGAMVTVDGTAGTVVVESVSAR